MPLLNPSYTTTRMDVLQHIAGHDLRVLDVGCAAGENGRYLLSQGIAREVVGLELSGEMAEMARGHYQKVYVGSLNETSFLEQLDREPPFDCAILGDVLEHTIDPSAVLRRVVARLEPGGMAVISVPNMQHFDVFLHLFVRGEWPSNDRGIFDRTHLQMFTRKRLLRLIEDTNLDLVSLHRKYRARDRLGSSFRSYPFSGLLRFAFKDHFTFQYIAVTKQPLRP